jgi:ADP-ribose pyrophosphatase YjhB (NUDIX family)
MIAVMPNTKAPPNGLPSPRWLEWAREIQALAQTGEAFAASGFETQRYRRLAAIAAEIVAEHAGLDAGAVSEVLIAARGYATPKIDVRGAVVTGEGILLVQERSDGLWTMPGGWADVGDPPAEMVAREVREESGYEVAVRKVIGVFDANRFGRPLELFHAYKVVFLCEITGGAPRPSDETADVRFFPLDALPPLSSARTNERHVAEVRAHLADPLRPAAFD